MCYSTDKVMHDAVPVKRMSASVRPQFKASCLHGVSDTVHVRLDGRAGSRLCFLEVSSFYWKMLGLQEKYKRGKHLSVVHKKEKHKGPHASTVSANKFVLKWCVWVIMENLPHSPIFQSLISWSSVFLTFKCHFHEWTLSDPGQEVLPYILGVLFMLLCCSLYTLAQVHVAWLFALSEAFDEACPYELTVQTTVREI